MRRASAGSVSSPLHDSLRPTSQDNYYTFTTIARASVDEAVSNSIFSNSTLIVLKLITANCNWEKFLKSPKNPILSRAHRNSLSITRQRHEKLTSACFSARGKFPKLPKSRSCLRRIEKEGRQGHCHFNLLESTTNGRFLVQEPISGRKAVAKSQT